MRPLNNNEVVHHKNFNGYDNSPDNLQIMTKNEHIFGNPHPKKSNEIRSKTLKKVFFFIATYSIYYFYTFGC